MFYRNCTTGHPSEVGFAVPETSQTLVCTARRISHKRKDVVRARERWSPWWRSTAEESSSGTDRRQVSIVRGGFEPGKPLTSATPVLCLHDGPKTRPRSTSGPDAGANRGLQSRCPSRRQLLGGMISAQASTRTDVSCIAPFGTQAQQISHSSTGSAGQKHRLVPQRASGPA